MEYSTNTLTSAVACDAILEKLKEQRKLLWKEKDWIKALLECAIAIREQANANLMDEWNELEGIEERVTPLPAVAEKQELADYVNEQFKELTVTGLEMIGSISKAILRKQYELACVQGHLIENVRCVKAVKNRMTQI